MQEEETKTLKDLEVLTKEVTSKVRTILSFIKAFESQERAFSKEFGGDYIKSLKSLSNTLEKIFDLFVSHGGRESWDTLPADIEAHKKKQELVCYEMLAAMKQVVWKGAELLREMSACSFQPGGIEKFLIIKVDFRDSMQRFVAMLNDLIIIQKTVIAELPALLPCREQQADGDSGGGSGSGDVAPEEPDQIHKIRKANNPVRQSRFFYGLLMKGSSFEVSVQVDTETPSKQQQQQQQQHASSSSSGEGGEGEEGEEGKASVTDEEFVSMVLDFFGDLEKKKAETPASSPHVKRKQEKEKEKEEEEQQNYQRNTTQFARSEGIKAITDEELIRRRWATSPSPALPIAHPHGGISSSVSSIHPRKPTPATSLASSASAAATPASRSWRSRAPRVMTRSASSVAILSAQRINHLKRLEQQSQKMNSEQRLEGQKRE